MIALQGVGAAVEALGVDPRIAFAFSAGVVTFFAPCAYPLLPGYVAYFLGQGDGFEDRSLGRRLLGAVLVAGTVSAGFLLVYAALVGVVLAVGTAPLRNVAVLELVVGAVLVALGATMATGRFDPTLHVRLPERRRSTTGYLLFGVVYAAAAAGCTAPLFVGIATTTVGADPVTAVTTFLAYALGMSLLMVAVTVASALGRETLLRRLGSRSDLLTRIAGVVLVVAGLVQVYFFLFRFRGLETLGLA